MHGAGWGKRYERGRGVNGLSDLLGLYVGNGLGVTSGAAQRAYQKALAQNQLLMQQVGMTSLAGLANMPQPKPSNVTPIRPERTPEEIQAQLEARMAELEREAASPRKTRPCNGCRHQGKFHAHHCKHPLVVGFERPDHPHVDYQIASFGKLSLGNWPTTALCGHEKALWEPIPTRWQRFTEWLAKVIERMEGSPPLATRHRKG